MLRQTRFLAAAFQEFERSASRRADRIDEHGLRRLPARPSGPARVQRIVIVTVPDQAADPRGLWTADFDLLARLPGVERIDVIATENLLAPGFHQRLHDLLPGIEEETRGTAAATAAPCSWRRKRLRGNQASAGSPAAIGKRSSSDCRAARQVRRLAASASAVVFQRPLPYLYLARQRIRRRGLPYQALDSLPLAAEPFAAAIDLVFTFALAEATRAR